VKVLAIARRELAALFTTPVGWLVLTAWLLTTGVFWMNQIISYVELSATAVYQPYAAEQQNLPRMIGAFFGDIAIIVLMISPAISMRLFAEEYKQHTLELLFTSPVSIAEIVLGKYLGAMGFLVVLQLCTLHYPLMLWWLADPHLPAFLVGYGTILAMGSVLVSLGMVFSAYTSNQIVASVLALGGGLGLFLISTFADTPDTWVYRIALIPHLADAVLGSVHLTDIVYFGFLTLLGLFVTHQRLESFRWG
jgi:ABC-2 type transport system permease protein